MVGVGVCHKLEGNTVSLDRKLKLEIGRYELRSSGLRDGFFKRAITTACFWDVGRIRASNEALHTTAMTGANTLIIIIIRQFVRRHNMSVGCTFDEPGRCRVECAVLGGGLHQELESIWSCDWLELRQCSAWTQNNFWWFCIFRKIS